MPLQVNFSIWSPGKAAPDFNTNDRVMARIEYNERIRNGKACCRLQQQVTSLQPLTKSEEYLYLVYEVRHLQQQYFNHGRDPEVFKSALAQEKRLDDWNTRTRFHLQGHPKYMPDDERAFNFFILVEKWREKWKEYFRYKKQRDVDPVVTKERSKECRQYEKQIDQYVRENIGLL